MKKIVKICQALEVPLSDLSWPLVAGGSAVRSYPHLLFCYKRFEVCRPF